MLYGTIIPNRTELGVHMMAHLSVLLGIDARYVVYPLIAVIAAGILRFGLLRTLRRKAARTATTLDDHVIRYLESLVTPLLTVAVLYYVAHLIPVPSAAARYIHRGLGVAAILIAAVLTARLITVLLADIGARRESWSRFLQPLATLAKILLGLLVVALSIRTLGLNFSGEGARLVRIVGILVGAYILLRIIGLAALHLERLVEGTESGVLSEAQRRARTLGKIINSIGYVLVIGVSAMLILDQFGINIMPIITGAGIAGLAVGFGAQNLVRDVISGFFLILEDQIRVGDVARINGTGGAVEAIRLRTTILRDMDGTVHIFPNGEIKAVSNLTKEYAYYVVDLGIAYKENVDEVMEVLRGIGAELAEDPEYRPYILEPLEVLGVDDFGDSQVTLKLRIKTLPLKQWAVGRELRRRIKNGFDGRGIEIPFPHLSVYWGEASRPFEASVKKQEP